MRMHERSYGTLGQLGAGYVVKEHRIRKEIELPNVNGLRPSAGRCR